MPGRGKIVVVRGGAIGDFILTLPVLAALRRQFPETRLELLGYPRIATLALEGGLVDAVHAIEARKLATFFAPEGALEEDMKSYFQGCDVIISYLYDPDGVFRNNIARCSCAHFIQGPHRPDETLELHATQCLLKPLEHLTIFDADPSPSLTLRASENAPQVAWFPEPSAPWVALHPGSGSESKNWPEMKWRDLIWRLAEETPLHLLLVGGEAEGERLERLASYMPADRLVRAFHLPLSDLGRRLAKCRLFLGHDSGITHLAAALGIPCFVLWGVTSEKIWRPRGASVSIVRNRLGLKAITVEEVFSEITASLKIS